MLLSSPILASTSLFGNRVVVVSVVLEEEAADVVANSSVRVSVVVIGGFIVSKVVLSIVVLGLDMVGLVVDLIVVIGAVVAS